MSPLATLVLPGTQVVTLTGSVVGAGVGSGVGAGVTGGMVGIKGGAGVTMGVGVGSSVTGGMLGTGVGAILGCTLPQLAGDQNQLEEADGVSQTPGLFLAT